MRSITLCTKVFIVVASVWMAAVFLFWNPAEVSGEVGAPKMLEKLMGKKADTSELSEVITLLENPAERDKFLSQLKAILEAREKTAAVEKKKPDVPPAPRTSNIEKLAKSVKLIPGKVLYGMKKSPEALRSVKAYFSQPENLRTAANALAKLAVALLLGIVIYWVMRRYLNKYRLPPGDKEPARPIFARLRKMVFNVGMDVSPALALLAFSYIFVEIFVLVEALSSSILTLFWAVFLYSAFNSVAEQLLSPGDPEKRILPQGDEMASYVYIWVRRFILLSIYFYLTGNVLGAVGVPQGVINAINQIYRLGLVIFAAIILAQWRDAIRKNLSMKLGEGTGAREIFARSYNYILDKALIVLSIYIVIIYLVSAMGARDTAVHMVVATIGTAIMLAVAGGLMVLINLLFRKIFSISERFKERFPGLEKKSNRYFAVARTLINVFIFAMVFLIILEMWGLNVINYLASGAGSLIVSRLLAIAATIVIAMLVINLSKYFIHRLLESKLDEEGNVVELSQKGQTFFPLINNIVRYITTFIAGIIILQYLGLNIMPILAGAGIVGLAIGFGAQSLVKDIINGFFILFENTMAVGDVAVINGTGGMVEAINLRTIRLRDLAGNVHVIPNSSIGAITNMTKEFSRYVIDVGVAYREDPDEVIRVLKEIGEELNNDSDYGPDILEPLEIMGVEDLADSAVVIRIRITTKRLRQWYVGRELKRRIKKTFDEKNIEIPFPHSTIYMGDPKHADVPPLHVKMSSESTAN